MLSRRLTALAVVIALLASGVFVSGGALGNQTSASTQSGRDSLFTLSPSNSTTLPYVESVTSNGAAEFVSNGSAVIITPPNKLPDEGYYPKRTSISYELTAKAGTVYTIFLYTKYDGRALLFGGYQAFVRGSSPSSIATIFDFANGQQYNSSEPLSTLASVLTDGQIAIIFVPLSSSPKNLSTFGTLSVESVQTTWGLLPFGSSGFLNQSFSGAETTATVAFMLILSTALPVLLAALLWRRFRSEWLSARATVILFAVAAAIRLALAPVTGFIDTDNFAATSSVYFGSGAFGVDWVSLPGFLYVEFASYFPYALMRSAGFSDWAFLAHSTFVVETVFVKLPSILSDLGIALLLAKFAEKYKPEIKGTVLVLYLFNPLTVYLSGVYGQFDSVFVFLLLATVYSHFVSRRTLQTGLLLGATSLVNPVGFILWIALLVFDTKSGNFRRSLIIGSAGAATFLAGLAPILTQSNSVLLTTLERLTTSYPGDTLVGTNYNFIALGQVHYTSVGYGLTFRFLLELIGYSAGSYLYPVAAAGAFMAFALLIFAMRRRAIPTVMIVLTLILGSLALFQIFYPFVFLQFVLWPFAVLLCTYIVGGDARHLSLALFTSYLTGALYVVLVDKPFDRAVGAGLELYSDLRIANSIWAMVGLVYSALMLYIVILSIESVRRARPSPPSGRSL